MTDKCTGACYSPGEWPTFFLLWCILICPHTVPRRKESDKKSQPDDPTPFTPPSPIFLVGGRHTYPVINKFLNCIISAWEWSNWAKWSQLDPNKSTNSQAGPGKECTRKRGERIGLGFVVSLGGVKEAHLSNYFVLHLCDKRQANERGTCSSLRKILLSIISLLLLVYGLSSNKGKTKNISGTSTSTHYLPTE
jgi:hypothetical protein